MKYTENMLCPECGTIVKDEFPEVDYVGCSGCSRIFER
jgi:protein-arginine kinase activator protein McsA